MTDVLTILMTLSAAVIGYIIGHSRGNDHGIIMAIKASCVSVENDLKLAYHMGYDDALAKRKPDASKTQILASDDLTAEKTKMREL